MIVVYSHKELMHIIANTFNEEGLDRIMSYVDENDRYYCFKTIGEVMQYIEDKKSFLRWLKKS